MLQRIVPSFVRCSRNSFASLQLVRSHSTNEDAREKARQKIAEIEANKEVTANSPIGLMERSPGANVNDVPTYFDEYLTDGEKKRFEPFPENKNPQTGEVRGPTGPEPTRYGDWERKGRCSDF